MRYRLQNAEKRNAADARLRTRMGAAMQAVRGKPQKRGSYTFSKFH